MHPSSSFPPISVLYTVQKGPRKMTTCDLCVGILMYIYICVCVDSLPAPFHCIQRPYSGFKREREKKGIKAAVSMFGLVTGKKRLAGFASSATLMTA